MGGKLIAAMIGDECDNMSDFCKFMQSWCRESHMGKCHNLYVRAYGNAYRIDGETTSVAAEVSA